MIYLIALVGTLIVTPTAYPIDIQHIRAFFSNKIKSPFDYDLAVKLIPSTDRDADYTICCHGSGGNNQIADDLKSYGLTATNLIGFNFPDHDKDRDEDDPKLSTFGTIQELLPFIYVLKQLVVLGGLQKINLYGFSAGGGVIINTLAILSTGRFQKELNSLAITQADITKILDAIKNGLIILDCPLKSIDEIIAFRGSNHTLETYAARYRENNLRPIDSIKTFKHLKLSILLYFETLDEKLSNRDDKLYGDLLKRYNSGTTYIVSGCYGGHCANHDSLWAAYYKIRKNIK